MSNKAKQRIRSKIQEQIDQARAEHQRELMKRRIELARQGFRYYQQHQISDAVKAFHTYLRIVEDWKGVPEGGLHPKLFDRQKEAAELLLISGVYWDLTKLYDRTKSKTKNKEFLHYIEKYVIFSRGMPHQAISTETLRKYVVTDRPKHKEEFKSAYKVLSDGKSCFVATSLADVCDAETLPRLRRFRDEVLEPRPAGRRFIDWYYKSGPSIADAVTRLPQPVRKAMGWSLDQVARAVSPSKPEGSVQDRADAARAEGDLAVAEIEPE